MNKKIIIAFFFGLLVATIGTTGCIKIGEKEVLDETSAGLGRATLTEKTYLWGDDGLNTVRYDMKVTLMNKVIIDEKDLTQKQVANLANDLADNAEAIALGIFFGAY